MLMLANQPLLIGVCVLSASDVVGVDISMDW